MKRIHTLSNHFADELGVTEGTDKHSEADGGERCSVAGLHRGKHRQSLTMLLWIRHLGWPLFLRGDKCFHSHRGLLLACCEKHTIDLVVKSVFSMLMGHTIMFSI